MPSNRWLRQLLGVLICASKLDALRPQLLLSPLR
jgi:hypothetical protein